MTAAVWACLRTTPLTRKRTTDVEVIPSVQDSYGHLALAIGLVRMKLSQKWVQALEVSEPCGDSLCKTQLKDGNRSRNSNRWATVASKKISEHRALRLPG